MTSLTTPDPQAGSTGPDVPADAGEPVLALQETEPQEEDVQAHSIGAPISAISLTPCS